MSVPSYPGTDIYQANHLNTDSTLGTANQHIGHKILIISDINFRKTVTDSLEALNRAVYGQKQGENKCKTEP